MSANLRGSLGLLLAGLGFLALSRESRSQAEVLRPGRVAAAPAPGVPVLCERRHPGGRGGETGPLDLGAVRRAYTAIARGLARLLDAAPREATSLAVPKIAERSHDAGLPACRETAERRERLPRELGARLRGRTLYFASLGDPDLFRLPPEIARDTGAFIFLLSARSLGELRSLEGRLGRPVSLADAFFARALGVRCANTRLVLSESGEEAMLHENP